MGVYVAKVCMNGTEGGTAGYKHDTEFFCLGFLWAGLGCWVAALASGIGSGMAVVDFISFRLGAHFQQQPHVSLCVQIW